MATLPYLELPHLALGIAALVALSGCSVSVDVGDADERMPVATDHHDIDIDAE